MAEVLHEYPDELRADFQETYSLNIDDLGVAYSVHHASVLCAQLPPDSRVFRAVHPSNAWDKTSQLLAWIEYNQRKFAASLGGVKSDDMKPLIPDDLLPDVMKRKKTVSMSIEDFDEFRNRKRKEVT